MRKTNPLGSQPAGRPAPPPSGAAAGAGPDAQALVRDLPWGVVVLDAHGTVLRLNEQAAAWWGVPPPAVQGQPLGEATAGTLPPDLRQALQRVPGSPEPVPGEFFLPQHQQWIAMTSARQGPDWVVYWQDITAEKQLEGHHQARQAASAALLRRTEAVARTGSYELALDTGHFHFSDGLYRLFGEEPGAFVPTLALIDARSHPDDGAAVQLVLARAVADHQPYYYQRRVYQPGGELRTLECHGRVECDAQRQPVRLLGLLQDVTAREQAQQELLRVKDELAQRATDNYLALYNSMDEGFCIVEVLFDAAQRPADYRFLDVNPAFEKHTGLRGALGQTIRELVPTIEPLWADVYGRVARTGTPMRFEADVESMGRWFDINAFLIGPSPNRHVGVLFTDITARKRTEEILRHSEQEFRLLVTATSDIVYRMSADWTQMEQLVGKNFLVDTQHASRTWVEEYIPAEDQPRVQAAIAAAIGRKAPFELEHRVRRADGTVGWTYSRAIPVLDAADGVTGWLGTARDVSARKQAEAQLLAFNAGLEQQVAERTRALDESRHLLQTVFDSSPTAIVVMQSLSDAAGRPEDFEILIFNEFNKQVVGRDDIVGQRFTAMFPQTVPTGILARLLAVATTGEPADFEQWYEGEGMRHWFRHIAVRQNDLLVLTSEVITARKLLEQGQARSLALLQQSEAVASMGSWEYDLGTREFTWSDGLYRLFERPVGSVIRLQVFLDAVLDDDRPAAARLLRTLSTGNAGFDTTLRLRIGDAVKTVRFKAVHLPEAPGPPERVLGVCLDVSDVQRLEAENLALKLDRHKELLLAILQAQENERQRLGEVLHNGLGQILYATKLHLDQLDTAGLHALPALSGLYRQTVRLLADAMRQTRTLAHELVPTSLLDFGLPAAVRDVCRDLSTPGLRIACHVWGEELVLPQPVQVTLFRLVQELVHNIVRHAGATQATLELETLPGWVSLRAEDNGRGFDPQAVAEGLGLRTLRQAVALLGGTVAVDSSPEFGTHIRLRIPLPLFS